MTFYIEIDQFLEKPKSSSTCGAKILYYVEYGIWIIRHAFLPDQTSHIKGGEQYFIPLQKWSLFSQDKYI